MTPKDVILNSAIELFSKKGFEGVSIREIALHADVHFSSIRYHYGDKEDLYRGCLSKHGEGRLLSAQRFLSETPTSYEDMRLRLGFAIDDVFRIHNENPFLTKLILQEIESSNPRSDKVLKKTMVAMTETYVRYFQICQENKYISKSYDPLFLTQSLMGILHHFMRTEQARERLFGQKKLTNNESTKILVENILMIVLGKDLN